MLPLIRSETVPQIFTSDPNLKTPPAHVIIYQFQIIGFPEVSLRWWTFHSLSNMPCKCEIESLCFRCKVLSEETESGSVTSILASASCSWVESSLATLSLSSLHCNFILISQLLIILLHCILPQHSIWVRFVLRSQNCVNWKRKWFYCHNPSPKSKVQRTWSDSILLWHHQPPPPTKTFLRNQTYNWAQIFTVDLNNQDKLI